MFSTTEIQQVIDIINRQYSLMICTSLGEEILSPEDKFLLESYGINIDEFSKEFSLYDSMFLLGRLTSILKDQQVKQLSTKDFKQYLERGQFIPLSERERAELAISKEMTYTHLKGLANKVVDETRNKILEENKMQLIQTTISEGVRDRKSIQQVVSDLGHKTGEWDRDWKRIVVTEMQNIYELGRAAEIRRQFGEDALIYRNVFELACRHCIKLYTTAGVGSEPRIFKLSELAANGTNIGRKVADWKPVLYATHPFCRCSTHPYFKGQIWNVDEQKFEYGQERERKVIRTSQIKVTVGDKVFFV